MSLGRIIGNLAPADQDRLPGRCMATRVNILAAMARGKQSA
jgi:hypothetical protein